MDLRARINAEIARHEDMTIRSLSLKAGMSDSALHKFMTRKTKSLTVDNVEKLAKALGMTTRQLMFGGGADVEYIWDRIAARRREQALQVLKTFADLDPDEAEM